MIYFSGIGATKFAEGGTDHSVSVMVAGFLAGAVDLVQPASWRRAPGSGSADTGVMLGGLVIFRSFLTWSVGNRRHDSAARSAPGADG